MQGSLLWVLKGINPHQSLKKLKLNRHVKTVHLLTGSPIVHGSYLSQTSLEGVITEQETGEGLIGAQIILKQHKVFIAGAHTDFEGYYRLNNLDPGEYDVEVSYVGFQTQHINGVVIREGEVTKLDVALSGGVELEEVVITGYKVPLIQQDNTSTGGFVTAEQIQRMPRKNVRGLNANAASAKSKDMGDAVAIKGSRANTTVYYLDGVRVQGAPSGQKISKRAWRKMERKMEEVPSGDSFGIWVENDYISPVDEDYSTFSIDVDRASYSLMRTYLHRGTLPPADAIRTEEWINYFTYDYAQPTGPHPYSVHTELSDCPWQEGNWLMSIGLQGESKYFDNMPPSSMVFLLDVSGSMNDANKLPLVKQSLDMLINQLRPQDQVAIVVYAGAAGLVLPMTSGAYKDVIREAIGKLNAGGSTAGGQGIELAYKVASDHFLPEGNNRIILATDGDFNVGISHPDSLEALIARKRETGIFLTTLGYGMGNLKDNNLERLADKGNGQYAYIDTENEARKVFTQELTGTLYTIAKDVKLQLRFNPETVASYRLIGYENRILAKEDFDDDTKDAGEMGAGHSVTALYEIVPIGGRDAQEALATLELRYKKPDEKQSYLMQEPLTRQWQSLENTSDDFRWAAAVAGCSLLVKNSPYMGDVTFEMIEELATGAMGRDAFGLRKEFLALLLKMKGIPLPQ
ncbi:MAG: von Willebrand factor type A domain-containing protein [Saprospirales bacterium]|nr:von Willebrand factor type A domain-containing protein [Saprospirales bacterium]